MVHAVASRVGLPLHQDAAARKDLRLKPMSTDEMIACLGSCQDRSGLAALIADLSRRSWPNTPVEARCLEAARAAMASWEAYSRACQARHNAHRLRRSR